MTHHIEFQINLLFYFYSTELYLRWAIDQTQTRNMFHQIQALITKEKETRSKVNNIFRKNKYFLTNLLICNRFQAVKLRNELIALTKEYNDIINATENN